MQRRELLINSLIAAALLQAHNHAQALSLGDLVGITNADASSGVKKTLEIGAVAAVGLLGKADGFWGNELVRIALPKYLQDASKLMRAVGQGKRVDDLLLGMNRAAEQAVPLAKDLLVGAVKGMSVVDAKNILTGGSTSVTQFFASKTRLPLNSQFLPIVSSVTERIGLARQYNRVVDKAQGMGILNAAKAEESRVERHVTTSALNGLYLTIGEQEKKIRQNPQSYATDVISRVFGAVKR